MRRRIRWTRAGKWAGVITLVAIVGIWLASGWYNWQWTWISHPHGASMVAVGEGLAGLAWQAPRIDNSLGDNFSWRSAYDKSGPKWAWSFRVGNYSLSGRVKAGTVVIPLWALVLCAAAPTAGLWHLDRRRPPGACPACGYDLTGNTTGVCPECGKARPGSTASGM